MCNQYRVDVVNAKIWEAFANWRERKEFLDEHGRNMPPPFQSFPNTPGRIITLRDGALHLTEALWGMPVPDSKNVTPGGKPRVHNPGLTNIRETGSPHWRRWSAPQYRCLVPWTAFAENHQVTYEPTWFALGDDLPLAFFAGVWDIHARRIQVKHPEATYGEFYAFLTTKANAEVEPVHRKAMPVILRTEEECRRWLTDDWNSLIKPETGLQRPLPDGSLKIIGSGKEWRPEGTPDTRPTGTLL